MGRTFLPILTSENHWPCLPMAPCLLWQNLASFSPFIVAKGVPHPIKESHQKSAKSSKDQLVLGTTSRFSKRVLKHQPIRSRGAVEALKDQGFCRWSYTIRSLNQHCKNHARSISQARKLSSQTLAAVSDARDHEKMNQAEESLRKIMYMS
ncbi:hypothetical protein SAY87_001405 [Trapa incisa]|uniref:Uncharacterized protein n=1 Tax=Trapa incisa TaxID=236973 RepID=A0AAN7GKE8_9MYRT|nr:hypothetical protein SAY87_001405 [Trapa incisa]